MAESLSRVLQAAFVACASAAVAAGHAGADTPAPPSVYASVKSEVLLDNDRVLVEKYVLRPGQSTGECRPRGDQLEVFIKGGVLASVETGRATLWRDGRVVWYGAGTPPSAGFKNTGDSIIEVEWVTLKPLAAGNSPSHSGPPKYRYLNYPNIPGEDLLENDFVIVQRFTVNPGQWEGVHAHHPDMLFIHIKGGHWAARSKREAEHPYPEASPDGEVGWMPTIELSEGHESSNVGPNPIDLIWVTLKK